MSYDDPPPPEYRQIANPAYDYGAPPSQSVNTAVPPFQTPPGPPPNASRATKPIAIPATTAKLGSPFLRAYAPILSSYRISPATFLTFLDDLNRVAVASPPLQILGLAGGLVTFLPALSAQLVGHGVALASRVGTVAVSKGRTEHFLHRANQELFGPAGLKVEIAKLDALAKLAHMPILNAEGGIDKHASILEPLLPGEDGHTTSGQQRRLDTLAPWIEHLDLTPQRQLHVPDNALSKLSAGASERMRRQGEAKLLKDRSKAGKDYHKDAGKAEREYEKDMAKLDKKAAKGKDSYKVDRERAKVEREYEKEMGKVQKDRVKDDKEEAAVRRILWLVVRELGADSGVDENPYVDEEQARKG